MSVNMFAKRSQMTPLAQGVRAYVAPVDRTNGICVAFDPAAQGQFDLDNPPNPFFDLGWAQNFTRKSTTKYETLRNAPRGTASTQYRSEPEALVEFDLQSWGKLQMALAGGTQEMNVLATPRTSLPQGSGGVAIPASYVRAGSSDYTVVLDAGEMSKYQVGDIVGVDFDYGGATGYVGSGAPAAYLTSALDPVVHKDYTRQSDIQFVACGKHCVEPARAIAATDRQRTNRDGSAEDCCLCGSRGRQFLSGVGVWAFCHTE